MKSQTLSILIFLGAFLVSPGLASHDTCEERTIVASAVRTTEDVQAFVQCAYEFVQEVGFEEARRAFNEDERWKSGPTYVFVDEMTDVPGASRAFVFPPDPSLEGLPWGVLTDDFGSDLILEFYRVATNFGQGWVYYSFTNPATGRAEPKASYFKAIDWNGVSAAIGAGIYRRDLPSSCRSDEVNSAMLDSYPSEARLQEFVRCAAMELDSMGYFASVSLANDPRWRSGSVYLFGLDTYGYTLFTGSPANPLIGSELSSDYVGSFAGRNILGVADAFGESFLYYWNRNPATNQWQRKVTFVKRVVSFGVPVLIGAGFYLESPAPNMNGTESGN